MLRTLRRPLSVALLVAALLVLGNVDSTHGGASAETVPKLSKADQALVDSQSKWLDPQAAVGGDNGMQMAMHDHLSMSSMNESLTTTVKPDVARVLAASTTDIGGRWSSLPSFPSGTNAYHMTMGPNGKIMLMAGSGNSSTVFAAGTFKAYLWNPTTGLTKTIKVPEDMFCSGHMLMSNGKGASAGGTTDYSPWKGETAFYTFDFATETFTKQPNMYHGRWYPTLVGTPEGNALIVGGFNAGGNNAGTSEVYYPATNTKSEVSGTQVFPLYPHLFTTADNRYFYTGEGFANSGSPTFPHKPGFWSPFGGNTFTAVSGITNATQRGSGASCRIGDVRDQNIIIMGGGWPSTSSTNIINLNDAVPVYRKGPSLASAKAYVSCVELPDGTLLETNGGSANQKAYASLETSLLTSASATSWTTLNPMPSGQHRLYHSAAFLMDDGSVVSFGSNPKGTGETRSNTVLRYEPPYLFKGARPTLSAVPSTMTYGGTYSLTVSPDVTKVSIMSAPSPTHSMDSNQKQVILPVVNGQVTLDFNQYQFGRSYVRIFALNGQGVPSVAKWSKIQ